MSKFDWIKNFLANSQGERTQVKDFFPDIFDRYFFVHWAVGIIDDFPFDKYPENNDTFEEINLRVKIEREFNLFLNENYEQLYRPASVKEISERFKAPYSHLTCSKIKQTPGVEILSELSIKRLKSSLTKISEGLTLNLFIEDIYRDPFEDNPKQMHENINLTEYFDFQEETLFDYFTYLFPDNLDWCLSTGEDAPMILACKNHLADSLQSKFDLELFELNYVQNVFD
ncbi:MAG: hypothetical protein Kow0027_16550 [Saprospiraceae bacterium]